MVRITDGNLRRITDGNLGRRPIRWTIFVIFQKNSHFNAICSKFSTLKFRPVFGPNLLAGIPFVCVCVLKPSAQLLRIPFVCSNLLPNLQKGGEPCRNFAYYSMQIILSWRPEEGAMAQCPPLNTAVGIMSAVNVFWGSCATLTINRKLFDNF